MKNQQDQQIVSSLIIVTIVIMLVFAITGCSTVVPVVAKFPDAPGQLVSQPCPNLKKLNDDAALSTIARTITENYTSYYECAVKLDAWIEWHAKQKIIFEGAGK
jgi:hypothetical protein